MEFKHKYRLALWKSYIDRGRGLTSYFNELFLIFGVWNVITYKSSFYLILIFLAYVILCFVVGKIYFKYGWQEAENEVSNQYNLFQKQLRDKMEIQNVV